MKLKEQMKVIEQGSTVKVYSGMRNALKYDSTGVTTFNGYTEEEILESEVISIDIWLEITVEAITK